MTAEAQSADFRDMTQLPALLAACVVFSGMLLVMLCLWSWRILSQEMNESSTVAPRRLAYRLPFLELLSLVAAVCAAVTFAPDIMQHSPDRPHARPQQLAADASDLTAWLVATGTLRLYWHSSQLQQVPLLVLLSVFGKVSCTHVSAIYMLTLLTLNQQWHWNMQDVLQPCAAITQLLFLVALLAEHKAAKKELHTWQESREALEPLLPFEGEEAPPLHVSRFWLSHVLFYWVNPLMARGSQRQLQVSDLFALPPKMQPSQCSQQLWSRWASEQHKKEIQSAEQGHIVQPSLLKVLFKAYGWQYLALGLLKLANDILNFAGPLLLNALVQYLEHPASHKSSSANIGSAEDLQDRGWLPIPKGLRFGICCTALLGLTSLVKAFLNAHYNYQLGQLSCQLRSAVTCVVFKKAMLVSTVDMTLFSSGAVQTLMSVDADRVVNLCASLHELWSLPAQIGIALFLLYTQVRYAFLAGIAVVVLLIPLNRWLASKIQGASTRMMAYKDTRLQCMGELLHGILQIKMSAWEPHFINKVREVREEELKALAVRKYLDALCVYFWAATSLLFSLFTFGLFVLLGHKLTAEVVFTSLALFNVLIAPLNSFPWVLNGIVEAVVSVRRLQNFLVSWETSSEWAYVASTETTQATPSQPAEPIRPNQLSVLAEGLSTDALNRADSSHLYTTINMERLPSALLPALTTAPSLRPQPAHQQQASHTLTTLPHRPSPLGRAPPPPTSSVAPPLAAAGRLSSGSFKDWGRVHSTLPSALSNTSVVSTAGAPTADRQDSLSFARQGTASPLPPQQEPGLAHCLPGNSAYNLNSLNSLESQPSASPAMDDMTALSSTAQPHVDDSSQGIVTVVSDSGRLATATSLEGYSVVLSGASFSWHPTLGSDRVLTGKARHKQSQHRPGRQDVVQMPASDSKDDVSLQAINLTVKTGSLLLVMGEIGSGKSSLLAALLGEMDQRCGHMRLQGSSAYMPQQPWILSGSVRDNILFGKPWQQERYTAVLEACALQQDVDTMANADETVIGDRGATLSGGQRARLSLARAIYQDCDVYLLDDILAAVDAHVAAWLVTHAINGPLLRNKTRIVCSNSRLLTLIADQTLRLHRGKIISNEQSAQAEEQVMRGGSVRGGRGLDASPLSIALGLTGSPSPTAVQQALPEASSCSSEATPLTNGQPVEAEEGRDIGHVKWPVYVAYMKAVGAGMVAFVLLSITLMQVTHNGNDLWLSYWVSNLHSDRHPHHHHHPHRQLLGNRAPNSTHNMQHSNLSTHQTTPQDLLSNCASLPQELQQTDPYFSSYTTACSLQYAGFASSGWCSFQATPFQSPNASVTAEPCHTQDYSSVLESAISTATFHFDKHIPLLDPDTKFYLLVLLCIAAANSLFTFVRAFAFAYGGLAAARKLHEQLLSAIVQAPARFFHTTPSGRILNRFSSDTATADDSLPFTLNILLANLFGLFGSIVVLCLSEPWLLLALAPLAVVYKYLQTYYRDTARELRRLNSIARSPVYATFSEALHGAASIRAYQAQQNFCALNEHQVAVFQQASFAGIAAAQWLGLRLQAIASVLVTLVALLAVLGHEDLLPFATGNSKFAASLVGLSLAYALPITDRLNGILTVSAESEQELVAVERLAEYTTLPPQPLVLPVLCPNPGQSSPAPSGRWPQGHVQFMNVHLQYSPDLPEALTGISFELRPGQKVGICGRTGAGKSSLVTALLRLSEISVGQILIDGRDCRTVSLPVLRRAVGVVPQTSFLFKGTIRDNLDPMQRHSNKELIGLLKMTGLWDILAGLSLSRAKASGPAVSAAMPYASSITSSILSGTPPRSPSLPLSRLATRPPLRSNPAHSLPLPATSHTSLPDPYLQSSPVAGSSLDGEADSQKEDAESHTSLAPGVRSASSSDRRSLTRVLHVPPLPSASSAPAFPLGSPFDHSLIASTTPSLPSHQPSRALPGGLSRSFGASGSTAGGHNPVPAPNGTADSNTARQPTPSSTSQTGIQSALSTPSVPHAAPTSSMASAFTSAAASGLPPLSPVQPASSVPQQHPVGQLPVALALQASSSVEEQSVEVQASTSAEQASSQHSSPSRLRLQHIPSTTASPLMSRHGSERLHLNGRSHLEPQLQAQWPNVGGQLLSLQLGEGGVGLSQGQQQVLCLARVLLDRPRIVCLDEATANVDADTARIMQHIIATHLQESTVLQIAHSLDSVLECDWIVVMDKGTVLEQGHPQKLLQDNSSHFAVMHRAGASGR